MLRPTDCFRLTTWNNRRLSLYINSSISNLKIRKLNNTLLLLFIYFLLHMLFYWTVCKRRFQCRKPNTFRCVLNSMKTMLHTKLKIPIHEPQYYWPLVCLGEQKCKTVFNNIYTRKHKLFTILLSNIRIYNSIFLNWFRPFYMPYTLFNIYL